MTRKADIERMVAEHFSMDEPTTGLPLAVSPIGPEEIAAGIDTLLSGWLTMGRRVREFEDAWADAIGTKHVVCVNSIQRTPRHAHGPRRDGRARRRRRGHCPRGGLVDLAVYGGSGRASARLGGSSARTRSILGGLGRAGAPAQVLSAGVPEPGHWTCHRRGCMRRPRRRHR